MCAKPAADRITGKDQVFLKEQFQQITAQIEQAKKFVDPVQLELPALQSQFNEQAQITEKLQKTWADWQVELNQVQSKQQQLTEQRHSFQQQDEQLRSELEAKRLAWQAARSDLQHYSEQLKELNHDVISGLNIDIKAHQAKLEKLKPSSINSVQSIWRLLKNMKKCQNVIRN